MTHSFAVVIPAYNAEKTIEACLLSVASQSLRPVEVLVVDDFSSDQTRLQVKLLDQMFSDLDIQFTYICLEQNSGPSVARNYGMKIARCQYVAFLDADDVWHCDKLLIISQVVVSSMMPNLIFHSYCDNPLGDLSVPIITKSSKNVGLIAMLFRNPAQTSCVVVRNDGFLLFNASMRYCEDYDLWLRIAEKGNVTQLICLPLTRLGRPQLTAGGLSSNIWRMRLGEMRAYIGFCRRHPPWRYFLVPFLLMFSVMKHIYLLGSRSKLT